MGRRNVVSGAFGNAKERCSGGIFGFAVMLSIEPRKPLGSFWQGHKTGCGGNCCRGMVIPTGIVVPTTNVMRTKMCLRRTKPLRVPHGSGITVHGSVRFVTYIFAVGEELDGHGLHFLGLDERQKCETQDENEKSFEHDGRLFVTDEINHIFTSFTRTKQS
jgi:hypothetical protein